MNAIQTIHRKVETLGALCFAGIGTWPSEKYYRLSRELDYADTKLELKKAFTEVAQRFEETGEELTAETLYKAFCEEIQI